MATVIVNSSVWNRIHEYYDNVETKYPNTWNINDTIAQISKIQWVISNFENVCFWSRESIILYWKRMGWKETWHRSSPWHFAFEYKRVNEQDYIFIQDAEHQDDIKESSFNLISKIIENKLYNTMKNTRNKVRLTESQLHNVIKESVKQVLSELDWKTYQNAAKKSHLKALDNDDMSNNEYYNELDRNRRFRQAAEDAFNRDYGTNDTKLHSYMHGSNKRAPDGVYHPFDDDSYIEMKKGINTYGTYYPYANNKDFEWSYEYDNSKYRPEWDRAKQELKHYQNGDYDYDDEKGWHLKDNMDESIRRAIRKVLH